MRRDYRYLIIDLVLIALATFLAGVIRDDFNTTIARQYALLPYGVSTIIISAFTLPLIGSARTIWRFTSLTNYVRLAFAAVVIVVATVALGFVTDRLVNVPRALPVLQAILIIIALVGARVAVRAHHSQRRKRPKLLVLNAPSIESREAILVVGLNRVTELYLQCIHENLIDSVNVVGVLGRSDRHLAGLLGTVPVLGVPEDITRILNDLEVRGIDIDRIVLTVAIDKLSPEAQDALLLAEHDRPLRLEHFAINLRLDEPRAKTEARERENDADFHVAALFRIAPSTLETLAQRPYWRAKRIFDVLLASVLLLVLWPVMIIVSALVLYDVGWPVLLLQQRPGLGGYGFKLCKFMTMSPAFDHRGRRIPDDRRVSAIGTFLRRTRLDELPQLLNIFLGQMSFVGPRPLLPIDQSLAHATRLLVRPGLTGWAQVQGGRAISPADKAALDVWYVKSASLRLDLLILKRTLRMVAFGERTDRDSIRDAWRDLAADGSCTAADVPHKAG